MKPKEIARYALLREKDPAKQQIDQMLPIYRGFHICEEQFVIKFKKEFGKAQTEIPSGKLGDLFGNPYLFP